MELYDRLVLESMTQYEFEWTHDATQVYKKIGDYTIWNLSISSPHSAQPFSVYETVEGKEIHIGAFATISETLSRLKSLTM